MNMWLLIIEVVLISNKKEIFGCLYHSPNSSDSQFLDFFEELLSEKLEQYRNHITITGDFNINWASDQ